MGDGSVALGCNGEAECPCSTTLRGSTQYLFCLDVATWEQARDRCRTYGAELVRIDDQDEQDFVWSAATDAVGRQDWWIGATDSGSEGDFEWSDGATVSFTAWADAQPDQGGAEVEIEEDCVEIHEAEDGRWNDLDCGTDYLDFICEGDAP